MAGVLESLARGLRQAGGVLNPQVQGILANESAGDDAFNRQVSLQMLQQKIADEREKALAGAIGPALQGGDFDSAARAAISSGAPGGVNMGIGLLGKAEDRKARAEALQQQLAFKQMELKQKHIDRMAELQQRGADAQALQAERLAFQRQLAEFNAAARQDLARFAASLRTPPQPPQPQLVTNDQGVFQIDRSGKAVQVMGDDGKPLAGKSTKADAPKPPSGYRFKEDGVTLEPIPGGPATVQSPEAAAKTELLRNGIKDVERYRDLVLKDGKVNREIIGGMSVPGTAGVPGTNSRLAYSYIFNAIEAKLRAESGAAVPETEVTRMAKRFVPSVLDNDATIKSKVDRLEEFLGGSLGRVKGEPGAGVRGGAKPSSTDDPLGLR